MRHHGRVLQRYSGEEVVKKDKVDWHDCVWKRRGEEVWEELMKNNVGRHMCVRKRKKCGARKKNCGAREKK
jgi:hypothetical protein